MRADPRRSNARRFVAKRNLYSSRPETRCHRSGTPLCLSSRRRRSSAATCATRARVVQSASACVRKHVYVRTRSGHSCLDLPLRGWGVPTPPTTLAALEGVAHRTPATTLIPPKGSGCLHPTTLVPLEG